MSRELGLIYRADRTLPRAATAFIDMIRQRDKQQDSARTVVTKTGNVLA
jgi:DNA-binding transcriptional LysR family regulator